MSFQSQNSGIGRGAFDYSFPRVPFPLDPLFHLENVKQIRVCGCGWVCVVRQPDPRLQGPAVCRIRCVGCRGPFPVTQFLCLLPILKV